MFFPISFFLLSSLSSFCLSVNYFELLCKHFTTQKFLFRHYLNKLMSIPLYKLYFSYNFVFCVYKGKSVPSTGSERKLDCKMTELSGCLKQTTQLRQATECTAPSAVGKTATEIACMEIKYVELMCIEILCIAYRV
jgi:hypothetical protein